MKLAVKLFVVILIIASVAASFLSYMGMFSKIIVKEEQKGPYTLAFVEHQGSYSGVAKPMAELDKDMRVAGFNSTDGIGLYYDDPAKTAKDKLRSEVGYIITGADMGNADANRGRFNFKTLEAGKYLTAEFPIRNTLSYMFGPMKVYPALNAYLKAKGLAMAGASVEIYDMADKKIYFLIKASK